MAVDLWRCEPRAARWSHGSPAQPIIVDGGVAIIHVVGRKSMSGRSNEHAELSYRRKERNHVESQTLEYDGSRRYVACQSLASLACWNMMQVSMGSSEEHVTKQVLQAYK
jgi:hypothetical protein